MPRLFPAICSVLRLAVVLGVVGTGTCITADEVPDLRDTIRKLIASRSEIRSYDLSITAKVDDEARPQELTDGSTFVPTKKLVAYKLDVVLDIEGERLLVARRDTYEDLATKVQSTEGWNVGAVAPDAVFHAKDGVEGRRAPRPDHFHYDPLGLGILFPAEFTRGDYWRTTAENYLKWTHQIQAKMVEDGVVRYTSDNNSFGPFLLEVDMQRDHWPLQLRLGDKDDVDFATRLKLSEVVGHWMPGSGKVTTTDMKHHLEFTWNAINKPVDERFEPQDIRKRYDLLGP